MYTTRIASTISEQIGEQPQELFDRYLESVEAITFEEFQGYCSMKGITITEDMFVDLLANNREYLFTESEEGWLPTKLDELGL
ncbi:MAG: hypothetical protein WC919_03440 [Candidatus Paceibacterota bacterium]|jgi:hypothetical protein